MNHSYSFRDSSPPAVRRMRAADFRHRAREMLRGRWGLGIGVSVLFGLLVFAPILLMYFIGLTAAIAVGVVGQEANPVVFAAVICFAVGLMYLCLLFMMPALSAGYSRFQLDLAEGAQETGAGRLFWGFRTCFGKSVRLSLAMTFLYLTVFVWMLILIAVPAGLSNGDISALQNALLVGIAVFLMLAGFGVFTVLGYQYSMCFYVLADNPTLGVLDAMRSSRVLMKGNKRRLFCLQISFIGWMLLAECCTCGAGFAVLTPYISVAYAVFYDEISGHRAEREQEQKTFAASGFPDFPEGLP